LPSPAHCPYQGTTATAAIVGKVVRSNHKQKHKHAHIPGHTLHKPPPGDPLHTTIASQIQRKVRKRALTRPNGPEPDVVVHGLALGEGPDGAAADAAQETGRDVESEVGAGGAQRGEGGVVAGEMVGYEQVVDVEGKCEEGRW
jgi:hypothetical protein